LSIVVARRKRAALYLSVAGLMFMVAAMSVISARDPDGTTVRIGMVMLTVGAAMWLPWQALLPATIAIWLAPNLGRNLIDDYVLFSTNMMLELPGLLGLAAVSCIARLSLHDLEHESLMLGMRAESAGVDPATGVFEESQLKSSIEVELSRSRRFGRTFALVLVGIDEMRQRFDYRDEGVWQASFAATAELLRGTRNNVDRVYRFGPAGFALILPESGPKEVSGLVRRLRRVARKAKPAESEPGGPLPAHYGATFYPTCATAADDLLRRAEIALRLADNNASRMQLDGAEAPEMPPVETLRQTAAEEVLSKPIAEAEAGAAPALSRVDSPPIAEIESSVTKIEREPSPAVGGPLQVTEPVLATIEEEKAAEFAPAEREAPQMLYAIEAQSEVAQQASYPTPPDATGVDQESPIEVFAYRAPEPAVDVYNDSWQNEAPLSVIRRPQSAPRLVALNDSESVQQEPVDEAISNALKQLDGTLELIRSLKQRSA
jgi:diguanylate cyclase (GGDEF)-like protein